MFKKALTFSYDDGVEQDRKLIEIFNKYGMKCTFNLNSGIQKHDTPWYFKDVVPVYRMDPVGLPELYRGHEVALHGLKHIRLKEATRKEAEVEVFEDKKNLDAMFGKDIRGMAYAYGSYNEETLDVLRQAGIRYARTSKITRSFDLWEGDMLCYTGTCHHDDEDLFTMGEKFLELEPNRPQLFYVWGHSYEFDYGNGWERIENFCKLMCGRDDILYGTNEEVFEYFGMI